tara:strand:+ start:2857 stop:5262 length:2406 start_codon:yes stop_codon:yes gene_type:complete
MGANYTRQSTYADGDTINAADTNDEFDQLLAAFAASTGHTHDGTTGEGGPISALVSNAITFGTGADTDIAVTFDANSNDGVVTWKEDEDYFEFSDDILLATTEKVQFRDTAIHISSSTDGQLDIVADNEVQIAATTIDINGNVDISGTLTIGSAGISEAELEILDGATVTTTELNIIDGDTTASSTTVVDADRVVMNDDGTMKQVAVTDLAAYFDDEITAMPNLTSVGTLTTLTVDNIVINGTNIGHTSDTDAIAIASDGDVTFSQDVVITGDLTVSGDDITMGTNTAGNLLIADGTNFNSVAVSSLSEISSVANDDVFIAVDTSGGGLKKITRSAIVSGLATSGAISNVVEDSTPQLGGNLDMNGNDIVTTSNANIELAANGTGHVVVKGNTNQGAITLNCEANTHGQKIIAASHSDLASASGYPSTLTLPSGGSASQSIITTDSTQTLANKSLTAPVLTGSSSAAGSILFKEDTDNGTNAVTLIGPASTADVTITLPSSAGTVALTSDIPSSGISSGNVATFTSGVADNDFLRIDGTAVEGRSASEVLSDIGAGTMSSFVLEDDDGTEVTIDNNKELKIIGSGVTTNFTDTSTGSDGDPFDLTITVDAAQTGITSLLATDIKIGEDDETKIDFETADEIHFYAANAEQVFVSDGVFGPQTDSDVDLGTTGARFKDAFVDSVTVTGDVSIGDDVTVVGRSVGSTITTEDDASYDLSAGNDFITTTASNQTLTFTNAAAGQSGNIKFTNGGNHTISAHASVAIAADTLTAISATGTYHLAYYCSAASGNNTILVSASAALT